MFTRVTLLLLFSLLVLGWRLPAQAQVVTAGKHKYLSVVPAPGKVTIDGNLDEWDLSGEILCYDYPETAARRFARIAAMYDAEALYLGVFFKDYSPMMNMVNPRTDPVRGWDADCLQFRIIGDPSVGYPPEPKQEAPNAACDGMFWYYTGTNEPAIAINLVTLQTNGQITYNSARRPISARMRRWPSARWRTGIFRKSRFPGNGCT